MTVVDRAPSTAPTSPAPARWWRRPWRPRTITLAALALIVVQAVIRGVWTSQSWFLVDDFLFMSDIARGNDDLDWYLRLHNGHFMPLSFGLVKLVTVVGSPFGWSAVAIQIIALQLVAAVACWWMLRTLFGNRPAVLGGLAFYLFTPLTMTATMWWAVAINQLPFQIGFFGLLAAHVQYCRTLGNRWLLLAAAFLTVAYVSYAKSPLIVVTAVLLTLAWFSYGSAWDRVRIALIRYRRAWVVYGTISLIWLATYLSQGVPASDEQRPSGFLDLAESMLFRTLLPALSGGPWQWVPFVNGPINYAATPLLLSVLSTVLVVAVVAYAWATRARAMRVLWAVAAYVFASALLIFAGRSFVLSVIGGEQVGRYFQYVSDIIPLLTVAGVALFVPVLGAFEPVTPRVAPRWRGPVPRPLVIAVAVFVIAGGLWSSQAYSSTWKDYGERTLTQRGIAQIEADDPLFADVGVPLGLLSPLFGDTSLIKNYYAPLDGGARTATIGNDLVMFDGEGAVALAGVRSPDASDLVADPAPVTTCLDVSTVGRWWTVVPPPSYGLWLEIIYQADFGTAMTIEIGDEEHVVAARPGRHRVLIATPTPAPTIHATSGSDQAGLCVTSVRYGLPAPVEGTS